MTGYIGIGGKAKKIKNIYIGVNGVAKQVKKAYIGVGGVAKRWYGALPTFAQLFSTIDTWSVSARTSGSAEVFEKINPASTIGETWYYFFCVGSSLEIARMDYVAADTMEKTRLSLTAVSDDLRQSFSVSGATAQSDNTLYGGFYLCLRFDNTYSKETIDDMLSMGLKARPAYYYSSTPGSSSSFRVAKSSTADYTGICLTAFRGAVVPYSTNTNNWSISDWSDPLSPIISYQDQTALDRTVFMEYTESGTAYYGATITGYSTAVYTSNYSMFRLTEDW